MEKPSTWPPSQLSPALWPANAFSALRSLIFIGSIVAAFVVGQIVASIAIRALGASVHMVGSELQLTSGLLIVQLVSYVPIIVVALTSLPFVADRSLGELGLRRPGASDILAGLAGAFAMYAVVEAAAYAQHALFHLDGKQTAVELFGTTHDHTLIVTYVIVAVFVAPFVEEIVFRGFLFNAFLRYFPVGAAAAISGTMFGLAHYERTAGFTALFPLACGGAVLAAVYYRTGSLAASMLAHGTFNAINVVLLFAGGGKA